MPYLIDVYRKTAQKFQGNVASRYSEQQLLTISDSLLDRHLEYNKGNNDIIWVACCSAIVLHSLMKIQFHQRYDKDSIMELVLHAIISDYKNTSVYGNPEELPAAAA